VPNGKPGDHPITDILHYGSSEYGGDVDALVKEMAAMPGFASVEKEVAAILWKHSPHGRAMFVRWHKRTALAKLRAIRDQLSKTR
jgi:hypothetical protein